MRCLRAAWDCAPTCGAHRCLDSDARAERGIHPGGDVLSSRPSERALVVSVELGSLIFSKQAQTPTDLVGVALFGDGAAAALLGGDDTPAMASASLARARISSKTRGISWDGGSPTMGCGWCCRATSRHWSARTWRPSYRISSATPAFVRQHHASHPASGWSEGDVDVSLGVRPL